MMNLQCLFLDRDGVINRERADYVKSWQEMEILPGVFDAMARLAQLNAPVIIITNQSAIGRQHVTRQAVDELHHRLFELIHSAGGRVDDVFLCPHHPNDNCSCRKPKPGLLVQAAEKYKLDLTQCLFVGDSVTDFQAATAVGCQSILVKSGRQGAQLEALVDAIVDDGMNTPLVVASLSEVVDYILL